MLTRKEVEQAAAAGRIQVDASHVRNPDEWTAHLDSDRLSRLIVYRDRSGQMHGVAYDHWNRAEAAQAVLDIMEEERGVRDGAWKDMARDLAAREMNLPDGGRSGRMGVKALVEDASAPFAFSGETAVAKAAVAGGDRIDWSDAPFLTQKEKFDLVAGRVKSLAASPESARYVLGDSDRINLLRRFSAELKLDPKDAESALQAEVMRAGAGRAGRDLASEDLREAVSRRIDALQTPEMIGKKMDEAVSRNARAERAELQAEMADHRLQEARLRQDVADDVAAERREHDEDVRRIMKEAREGIRNMQKLEMGREAVAGYMAEVYRRIGELRRDGMRRTADMQERGRKELLELQEDTRRRTGMIREERSDLDELVKSRAQEAMERSARARGESLGNEAALNACFPGGMGRTAQEAVQMQNAQNAEQSDLRAGR